MTLPRLAGVAQFMLALDGESYRFSELTVGGLAVLQGFIESRDSMPLEDLDDHIGDIWPGFHRRLRRAADEKAKNWPPAIGTAEGSRVLDCCEGRIETFHQGLKVHQPETTRDDAIAFYRALKRRRDGELIVRIFGAMFGAPARVAATDEPPIARRKPKTLQPIRWDVIFRNCAQVLGWTSDEVCRHTLTQINNALDTSDPDDSHKGGIPIGSLAELADMFE